MTDQEIIAIGIVNFYCELGDSRPLTDTCRRGVLCDACLKEGHTVPCRKTFVAGYVRGQAGYGVDLADETSIPLDKEQYRRLLTACKTNLVIV